MVRDIDLNITEYKIYNDPRYWNGDKSIRIMDDYSTTENIFSIFANTIKKTFNPKLVLDVACGYGYLTKHLNLNGIKAHGIEASEYAVNKAKQLGITNIRYGIAEELPYNNYEFDLIINMDLSAHLQVNTYIHAVSEMYRCSSKYIAILLEVYSAGMYNDRTHITFLTLDEWYNLLANYSRDYDKENMLNSDKQSIAMHWSPKWMVIKKC